MGTDGGSTPEPHRPSEPDDAQLIAETCAGNAAAFDALVRRHYHLAFSVALAHTTGRADAEDVCHDAFVQAAEHLEECRDRGRFAPWLCAIVRNRARNLAARNVVRRAEPIDHDTAASPETADRDAQLAELRQRLLAALATLSPTQREVVLMHDLDGLTHEEIAGLVGTSAGMSRQHLFAARKLLRRALGAGTAQDHFNDR